MEFLDRIVTPIYVVPLAGICLISHDLVMLIELAREVEGRRCSTFLQAPVGRDALALNHERGRGYLMRLEYRGTVEIDVAILRIRAQFIFDQLDVLQFVDLGVEVGHVAVARERNRGLEDIRGEGHRGHGHDAAVAGAGDRDPVGVHVGQGLQVVDARQHVLQVAVPPAFVVQVLELEAVAGAAADVGHEHDVAALGEEVDLLVAAELVVELGRGAAVDPHHAGEALARGRVRGPVQVGLDRETVGARVAHIFGHVEPVRLSRRNLAVQEPLLARRHVDDEELRGPHRGLEGIADARSVGGPLGPERRAHLRVRQHLRLAAVGRHHPQRVDAVPVLGVADPAAVRGPARVALVVVGCRDGTRLAAGAGHEPEVQPAAPLGAEEDGLAVRRDLCGAEGPSGAVVEKAGVPHDGARVAPVGTDLDDVVVNPAVVHAHVEQPVAVGGPAGIALVEGIAGQAAHLPVRHRDRPDVHAAEAVAREGDPPAVRRPRQAVGARGQPGEPHVGGDPHATPFLGGPEPDFRRTALVGGVGDPAAVG